MDADLKDTINADKGILEKSINNFYLRINLRPQHLKLMVIFLK